MQTRKYDFLIKFLEIPKTAHLNEKQLVGLQHVWTMVQYQSFHSLLI